MKDFRYILPNWSCKWYRSSRRCKEISLWKNSGAGEDGILMMNFMAIWREIFFSKEG